MTSTIRWVGAVITTVVAATTLTVAASPASASDVSVSTWSRASGAFWQGCLDWCFYYSQGLTNAARGAYGNDGDLGNNYFADIGYGSAGAGLAVRNNSASMGAGNSCRATTYVNPSYTGHANHVWAGWAGNLTDWGRSDGNKLRNNNASVKIC